MAVHRFRSFRNRYYSDSLDLALVRTLVCAAVFIREQSITIPTLNLPQLFAEQGADQCDRDLGGLVAVVENGVDFNELSAADDVGG